MNKVIHVALGLVIGLLAGLAIGVTLDGTETQRVPTADTPLPADAGSRDPQPPTPEPVKKTAEPAKPGRLVSSLSDVISSTEIPEIPRGEGAISGYVRRENGEGLAGVTIKLTPLYPADRAGADATLEEKVASDIRYRRWIEKSLSVSVTDAEGAYRFDTLSETFRYNIWPETEGWRLDRVGSWSYVKAGDTVDFIASPVVKLTVEVRMPDGTLAQSGSVSYRRNGAGGRTGTGIAEGKAELRLSPGEWTVDATHGSHNEYRSEPATVTIEEGKPAETLVMQLVARPGVLCRVKISKVFRKVYFHVLLVPNPPAETPGSLREMRQRRTNEEYLHERSPESDTCSVAFLEIAPGPYRLLLVLQNEILDWKDVTVADDLTDVELAVPEPDAGDYIVCRVTGPDDKLVKDLHCNLRTRQGTNWTGNSATVLWPEDGTMWIQRREPKQPQGSDANDWWYELVLTSNVYGTLTRRVERDDYSVQELRYEPAATLLLTVSGFNEHEYRSKLHWRVIVAGSRVSWGYSSMGGSSHGSPFKLGPYQPGNYELVLVGGDDGNSTATLHSETLVLVSGANEHSTSMPALHTVKVRCPDESTARDLRMWKNDGRAGLMTVDGAEAEFSLLPAGEYELGTFAGRMKVAVPAGGTVEFVPRLYDCLELYAIKAGGRIEQSGLRQGDKVFKVDGIEIEDAQIFRTQLMASLARETTTWTLLRNGAETELTFNGKSVLEATRRSGSEREYLSLRAAYRTE